MRMKKILAVVAAAAMTATMSLPVFAEDATTGDIPEGDSIESNVDTVKDLLAKPDWTAEDKADAVSAIKEYVAQGSTDRVVTEDMATCAMEAYTKMPDQFQTTPVETQEGTVNFYSGSDTIKLNSLTVSEEKDSVTIDVEAGNNSVLGYIVEIPMPGVEDETEYEVVGSDAGINYVQDGNTTENFSFKVKDEKLKFWVLHFTTYTLKQVSTTTNTTNNNNSGSSETQTTAAAPAATAKQASGDTIQYYTCPACGYHNWTATSEGYRCDNCGRIESEKQLSGYGNVKGVYEPAAAAVAENPIKATGSDMSLMVFAVVALAGVAACGLGVASKKSRKGE